MTAFQEIWHIWNKTDFEQFQGFEFAEHGERIGSVLTLQPDLKTVER